MQQNKNTLVIKSYTTVEATEIIAALNRIGKVLAQRTVPRK